MEEEEEEEEAPITIHFINSEDEEPQVIFAIGEDHYIGPEEVWINLKSSHSQQFVEKYKQSQETKRTLEEMVPPEFHQFLAVFSEQAAARFPKSRPWDHAINLKPDFEPKSCKIYPLTPTEEELMMEFLKDNLEKGYIRRSKSPNAAPFFFVHRKGGGKKNLRPIMDY